MSSESSTQNQVEVVNAYKEFYHTFYEEHITDQDIGNGYNLNMCDCAAKLLMDESGNLFLVVTDIFSYVEYDFMLDLYIYEYNGKEVVQKMKIPNIQADAVAIQQAEDIFMIHAYNHSDSGEERFCIKGNEYKEWGTDSEEEDIELISWLGHDDYEGMERFFDMSFGITNAVFHDSDTMSKYCMQKEDFEDWLTYYADNIVDSALRLDILYAEYLENNRFNKSDYPLMRGSKYYQDNIIYDYIAAGQTEGEFYNGEFSSSSEERLFIDMCSHNKKTKTVVLNIPEQIDGITVVMDSAWIDIIKDTLTRIEYFKNTTDEVFDIIGSSYFTNIDGRLVYKDLDIDSSYEGPSLALGCTGSGSLSPCTYEDLYSNLYNSDSQEMFSYSPEKEELYVYKDGSHTEYWKVKSSDGTSRYYNRSGEEIEEPTDVLEWELYTFREEPMSIEDITNYFLPEA